MNAFKEYLEQVKEENFNSSIKVIKVKDIQNNIRPFILNKGPFNGRPSSTFWITFKEANIHKNKIPEQIKIRDQKKEIIFNFKYKKENDFNKIYYMFESKESLWIALY